MEAWGLASGLASGDEIVVPHKGIRAGPLRQFIPRKPHSTGVKLYVLAYAVEPYVTNVYLYVGARGQLRRASTVQGNMNARQIVNYWADVLPEGTILFADSFFGSHEAAKGLAARGTPFLMLWKRHERGVSEAGEVLEVSIPQINLLYSTVKQIYFRNGALPCACSSCAMPR